MVQRFRALLAAMSLSACQTAADAGPRVDAPAGSEGRANLLLIVADDLGFSDLGAFGSEIPTPHLDRLAGEGLRLTNFHVSPSCAPSRAMLLTGVSPLEAGLGSVPEITTPAQQGQPGYEGELTDRVVTLAEILDTAGYYTFIAGKWHLGKSPGALPSARGFDSSFALLGGAASHFADATGYNARFPSAEYVENGVPVPELPGDFFSSTFFADRAIDELERAEAAGAPFFGYLAFTAPHAPLHAPEEWLDRFDGAYDAGFEAVAEARRQRVEALGLVPEAAAVRPGLDLASTWDALSPDQHADMARRMEVYAAMVAHMDHEIGRIIGALEASGAFDDTLIIFLSDNGPDPTFQEEAEFNAEWVAETFDNRMANYGRAGSYVSYGLDWARVSATPFHLFKGTVGEGGLRVPAIIRLPNGAHGGQQYDSYATGLDVVPTVLDVLDLPEAAVASAGNTLIARLEGGAAKPAGPVAWQSLGTRAIQDGRWKASLILPPVGSGEWALYDLSRDPFETSDLAAAHPERLARMIEAWNEEMARRGLIEPPAHFLAMLLPPKRAAQPIDGVPDK